MQSRTKEIKELDVNHDLLPPERVLGVEWNIENDAFKFCITLIDKPLMRRGILSTASLIYDPLGFATPFLLRGKRILQLLCRESIQCRLGWCNTWQAADAVGNGGKWTSSYLYSRKWWGQVQHLTNKFCSRWKKEFLLSLQTRQKWIQPRNNLLFNDVVIRMDWYGRWY